MDFLKSIKSKIMVFAVLATLIPSLGLGLLSFRQNEAQTRENVTRQLHALTSYADREIGLWMDKRVHEARVTAASGAVIDGLPALDRPQVNTPVKDPRAMAHYLYSVREKLDTILELTVVDAAGKTVASSARTPAAVTLPDDWPGAAATEGLVIAPPHWDERYGTASLAISVPVVSYDNIIKGVLVAGLDLRTLQSHLKSATNSPPGEVLLLDSNG